VKKERKEKERQGEKKERKQRTRKRRVGRQEEKTEEREREKMRRKEEKWRSRKKKAKQEKVSVSSAFFFKTLLTFSCLYFGAETEKTLKEERKGVRKDLTFPRSCPQRSDSTPQVLTWNEYSRCHVFATPLPRPCSSPLPPEAGSSPSGLDMEWIQ
jgi:hypothetical protein